MRKILSWTLAYTLLVIIWGAWVRISHSGDGCGASWPLCQGEIIPTAAQGKTWVEYTHRLMSGFYGILILLLLIFVHRAKNVAPQTKFWMKLTFLFMITEALLGAKLVLSGLVGSNDSMGRAFVMSLHFLNSLMLTGCLTLTLLFSEQPHWVSRSFDELQGVSKKILRKIPLGTLVLFLVIGMTGTIAALSNTLYPSDSFMAGLIADLDPDAHQLVRLRGLHPVLGVFLGTGLTIFFYLISEYLETSQMFLKRRAFNVALGFAALVIIGSLTLLLHAPLPLRLLHLLAAHGLWIFLLSFWQSLRYRAG